MHDVFPTHGAIERDPDFQRYKKPVVPNERVFPVAAYGVPSPDRQLLQRKEAIIRKLDIESSDQLGSAKLIETMDALKLSEPSKKLSVCERS